MRGDRCGVAGRCDNGPGSETASEAAITPTFTLPVRNGGRGKVGVNVKGYGDRWPSEQMEYDLRFLKVSVRLKTPNIGIRTLAAR